MLTSVEGVFQNGKVELTEPVPEGVSGRVIVTFLPETRSARLSDRGIDQEQAAELRARLSAFAEDWQRPEMDVYDVD
jgi:hypothetical protein